MLTQDSEIKISDKYVDDSNLFNNHNNIEINGLYSDLIILDNVLSSTECNNILRYYESERFVQHKQTNRYKNISNMQTLTNIIEKRCDGYIAGRYKDKYKWNYKHINDCWRCIKCNINSSLSSHFDASSVKSINEMSKYTVMIYLSDNTDGVTYFNKYDLHVLPVKGRCVIFDLKLIHSGEINSEIKYILRSELYYVRDELIALNDINYLSYELYENALLNKDENMEKIALDSSEMLSEMVYNY